jgi:type IX secretion system PorP/SprF family membrane protein
MRRIMLMCAGIIMAVVVTAQDPHFSQFFSSPLTLNPAFTGKFFGTYRVSGNYRNQWPTINNAFTSATASVDFQVMQDKMATGDAWGVGFMAFNDNSSNGAVQFNYGSFSTAYHKSLDEDGMHQIGLGVQATYANMLINTNSLNFEDQLTTAGFTRLTSEIFNSSTLKSSYVDLNAGLLYNGSTNDRNNFYLGVSMYHINQPKQSFTGAEYVLKPRTNIHAGGYFPLGINTTMHLSGSQSFQANVSQTIFGGAIEFNATPNLPNPTSLYVGGWLRLRDAIIPYIGIEFNNLRIGASYDYNASSLRTASMNRGGIELSLIYIRRPNTDRPVNCPKF